MKPTTRKAQSETDAPGTSDPALRLSSKLTTQIDHLRKPFTAFTKDYGSLLVTRADLAPKFMAGFDAYRLETGGTQSEDGRIAGGSSFVSYVCLFDTSVPADNRDAYRAHRTYQAADYLRRLVVQSGQAPKTHDGPLPTTPLVALARLVATVLPRVDPSGAIWAAFVEEMHWAPAMIARIDKLARSQGPVVLPQKARAVLRRVA